VDDVRVVQPGAGAGFAVKTFQRLRSCNNSFFINFTATMRSSVVSQARYTVPMPPDPMIAAQFELPQLHRHHDGMPAFAAGHRASGGKIAGDEHLRRHTSRT
jgi:hypothetical protein